MLTTLLLSLTVTLASWGRGYRLHVPANASADAPLPLVVAFHAAGSSAERQERASGLSALADRAGFVVVYPEGRGHHWTGDASDERFVREVIGDVERRVHVDAQRVYATGISNGGAMVQRAACRMNDVFAAIATVAGVYPRDEDDCRPVRPVPVLAYHGLADHKAPYAEATRWAATWAARDACLTQPLVQSTEAVTTRTWRGCASDAEVVFATIPSLGHAWPGDPSDPAGRDVAVDATAGMWAFFAAHPMR